MRILVVGAAGAIGARLTRQLTQEGHQVTGTSRGDQQASRVRALGAEPLALDILDPAAVRAAVAAARPDAIIHQATALAGARFGRNLDKAFAATNALRVAGTDNLLAAAREAGVGRFIAQSFAPYRYERSGGPVKSEDDPLVAVPPASARATFAAMAHVDEAVTTAGGIAPRYGGFYGEPDQTTAAVARRQAPVPARRGRGRPDVLHPPARRGGRDGARPAGRGARGLQRRRRRARPDARLAARPGGGAGRPAPRRVPTWLAGLLLGEALPLMTQGRGASNARARKELGWTPRYPSWREGLSAIAAP
ncbi:MAG TPA: NAD(P)-dependent oxidoreductase [Trebonia sp.]|nr:NAD(P)-dependent oxidoreductase [Trebonia sp.]